MKAWIKRLILLLSVVSQPVYAGAPVALCSQDWYRFVEHKITSGDGQGHGPDLGSDEWKGVVEFRLGIRDQPGLPQRDSEEWCELIDRLVQQR